MQHPRKLLILILLLVLATTGIVMAQSSAHYVAERFTLIGGGSAGSANYAVTSVIGQTSTGTVTSNNFSVIGGFLQPARQGSHLDKRVWLPVILK